MDFTQFVSALGDPIPEPPDQDGILRLHLQHVQSRNEQLQAVFDRLQIGIFVLDEHGRVMLRNAAADRLLRDEALLDAKEERLQLRDPRRDRELRQAMLAASYPAREGDRGRSKHLRIAGHESTWQLLVSPAAAADGRGCLVFVARRVHAPLRATEFLRQGFGLTHREAECALSLAAGLPPKLLATRFGIAANTVRAHLRNLYLKLGVHKQGALIALLNRELSMLGLLGFDDGA